jgi:hypothetical protein
MSGPDSCRGRGVGKPGQAVDALGERAQFLGIWLASASAGYLYLLAAAGVLQAVTAVKEEPAGLAAKPHAPAYVRALSAPH